MKRVDIFYPRVRQYINSRDIVEVEGNTVGECLEHLVKQFPGIEKWIFDEHGELLKHVLVCVNIESARKADLAAPVKDKDELIIAMLLPGG